MNKPGLFMIALAALSAIGSGCACMDRESYSLAVQKKVHRYTPLSPVEKKAVEEKDKPGIDPAKRDLLQAALAPDLEPFKPFAYCHHHQSSHAMESVFAVVAAPIEYPSTMTVTLGIVVVQAGIRKLAEFLTPDDPEKKPSEDEKERGPPK